MKIQRARYRKFLKLQPEFVNHLDRLPTRTVVNAYAPLPSPGACNIKLSVKSRRNP
jgi:hypothetical protein